jgi:hypothetical protein
MRKIVLCVLTCALLPLVAWSQTSTGTIVGTVFDGSHRSILGAKVTVTQETTKRAVTVKTTAAGVFSVSGLDSGIYDIAVSASTFGDESAAGIQLDAGATVTQDFTMKPGTANVSVTVTAESDLVQRDSTSVNNSVSNDLTTSIPLPDHSTLGLITLIPGVQGDPEYPSGVMSENPTIYTNPAIPGAAISISGSRPGLASQLIDGFDITQNGYPRAGLTFTPFAIKQLSVQMAGLPAEYGRTGGGIINQSSQEGGLEYHGTMEYRHTDPGFGQAVRTGSIVPSDHHQTIFGGVISGPVGIPGVPHTRLKNTFFLFTYEPLRMRDVVFSRTRLATPDELNGKFFNQNGTISLEMLNSTDLKTNGYAKAAQDAITSFNAGSPVNQLTYQYPLSASSGNLFPYGNKLPTASSWKTAVFNTQESPVPNDDLSAQAAANPVVQFLKKYYPTPANPGHFVIFDNSTGSYGNDGNNAYAARGVSNHDDRYSVRVDHTFGNSDHLFGRYSVVPVSGVRYNLFGLSNPLNSIPLDAVTSRNVALNFVHLFSANIVNETRASYLRSYRYRTPPPIALTQDYGAAMGLVSATDGVGMPALSFSDSDSPSLPTAGGGGSFQDGGRSLDEVYGYGNETTILFGRHQVKFGGEYRALQLNRTDDSNQYGGTYAFNNGETNGYGFIGSSLASLDLGMIYSFTTAGSQNFYYRWKYFAGFVQDSWKALPNLTINYGLRYNLEFPRSEKFNNQGSFLPNLAGTLNGYSVTGALVHSGSYGLPTTIFPVNYHGFEPRLGISYSPRQWVVVQTSFALMHTPLTGVGNTIEPTFAPAAEQIGPNTGGTANASGITGVTGSALDFISNPPAPIARIGANLTNPLTSYSSSALLPQVDQTNIVPYVEVWNFGLQFVPGRNTVIDATYVGQRGIHLYSPWLGTNLPSQATELADQQAHMNFNANVTNPYGLGTESFLYSLTPYQQFYNNPIYQAYNRHSQSNYNGVYLGAREQFANRLSLMGGFTWSKSMDTNSTPSVDGTAIDSFGLTYPQSPYAPTVGEYTVSSFDQPVRVTLGYNYQLPIGVGQPFFTRNRVISALFGGFSTSGYFSAQSGAPISVGEGNNGFFLSTSAGGTLGNNGATQLYLHLRPNLIPGVPLLNPNWKKDKLALKTGDAGFLNQAAFAAPGSQDNPALGNAPRELSAARSPRSINWDGSVRKNIKLHEKIGMQLYTDIQNVINHPNFFQMGGNVFTGSLSSLTPAQGPFALTTGFSVPTAFSPTRIINVGASVSF